MLPIRLTLLVLLLALRAMAFGQSCALVLSGRVLDDHDGAPLSYAEVFIPALGKGSVADEQGRYRIDGLCPGTYLVRVAHLGCETIERQVDLPRSATLDFRLEHHAEELRALEVVRSRPDEEVGQPHQRLGSSDLEREAGRPLEAMLARLPGVALLSSGPTIGKPVIHGLSGNRILILNQGIRQEDQQWGGEHAPSLDPLSTDRITVVKGAASVQHGSDAIAGVVIAEPVELPREAEIGGEARTLGQLNGRGGGASAMLQGGIKGLRGLGWRVQGSGRYLGDSEAPRYVLSNTGLREAGGSLSVGYRHHRRSATVFYSRFARALGILRAAHIGNLSDLGSAIASGRPWFIADFGYGIDAPRQTVLHHLLKADASLAVSERSRVALTYGYQANSRQEYDIRRGGRSATPALDLWLATHTAEAALKHWIGPRLHGRAGVSGLWQANTNIPGTGVRPLLPNYQRRSIGAYVVEHYPATDRLELEAGARAERAGLHVWKFDAANALIEPRLAFTNGALSAGANWAVADSARLRFSLATAYRPPHVSELFSEGLHHGAAAIEEGDAALGSERALKATVDVEASALRGRLRIEGTLHASRINGYIYLRPDGTRLTIRGAFPVFRYTATEALVGGADARLALRFARRWAWILSGSTVLARDLGRDEWLFLMPADRLRNELAARWPSAGAWRAIEAAVFSELAARQRRAPAGLDFTDPPGGYHLLGLTASAALPVGTGELRIGLQGANLLNAVYRDYLDRFRYYADARGTDILLSLRYAFGQR